MRTFCLLLTFMSCLASSTLARQKVWVVDDTPSTSPDFTDLQTAIRTVASGDVLLLETGVYTGMSISSKSLTIVADAGETPTVTGSAAVSFVSASKSVRLQGLTLGTLQLQACAGTIWVENCRVTAGLTHPGISVSGCSSVALLGVIAIGGDGDHCDIYGTGSAGLVLTNSSVHCYGCDFVGGQSGSSTCEPICRTELAGPGISTGNASDFLMLSGCHAKGGDSAVPGLPVRCNSSCATELLAGTGLSASLGTTYVLDCTLEGGQQRDCTTGNLISGPSVVGSVHVLPGHALRVTPLQPTRENGVAALHIEGPPHALIRMESSDNPGTTPRIDELRGTLLLALSPPPAVRTMGVTDASGVLDTSIALGPFAPGVEAQLSFLQFLYLQPELPIARRFGQPLGGFVLGQATLLVGLDDAF